MRIEDYLRRQVECGTMHSAMLTKAGELWCWGMGYTLNSQLSTLNPQLSALNLELSTLIPEPSALATAPCTLSPSP